jgi:two-component system, cell cycle response regulator CpdR
VAFMIVPSREPRSSATQIFLAEEDAALRAEIASALRADGYEIVECSDGAALFHQLERRMARPGARRSLVITQARLPGLGAIRILHSLRRLDIQIPVVLMTRLQPSNLPDFAERSGISAVLIKPFQVADLRRVVASILDRPGRPSRTIAS